MVHNEVETSAIPVWSYASVWVRRGGGHEMSSWDDNRTRPGTHGTGVQTLVTMIISPERVMYVGR